MNVKDHGVSTETGSAPGAEGPLRRWARRKREAAREQQAAVEARRGNASAGAPDACRPAGMPDAHRPDGETPEAAVVEERVLTDEDMPPLESLDEGSDYSGFLSPGVSEGLRRRALRKLFMSATFNVPDGLDDYDDDFTSFQALGDILTSDMKHQAEMEAERAKQARARSGTATAIEDESGAAGGEQPAQAEGDETVDGERVGLAREDVAEGAEPSGPSAVSERDSPVFVGSDGHPSDGIETSADAADAASIASGGAAGDGESSRLPAPAEHVPPDSVTDGRTSPSIGALASDGETAHRERGSPNPTSSPDADAPAPGGEAVRRWT